MALLDERERSTQDWSANQDKRSVVWSGKLDSWMILSHSAAMEVITSGSFSVSAYAAARPSPLPIPSGFELEPELRQRVHSSAMACVGPRTLPWETISQGCADVVRKLPIGEEIEFSAQVAEPAARALTGSWFGLASDELDWIVAAFGLAQNAEDPLQRAVAAKLAAERLRETVRASHAGRDENLLSRMARSWQTNDADDDSLLAFIAPTFDSLARGFGGRLLTHTAYHLSQQPEVQAQVRSDGWATARKAALESARLDPVNQTILRESLVDQELAGTSIAKGDRLIIVLAAVCRDPAAHTDPNRFLLNRKNRHLAFGHGTYACSGRELALAVAATMLTELLHRFGFAIVPASNKRPVFGVEFGRSCLEFPVVLERAATRQENH